MNSNPLKLKKGDRVVHKLTGQTMAIKRISGAVATLIKDIPEPWKFGGIEYPGDIAICLLENLEPINKDHDTQQGITIAIDRR